MCEIIKFWIGLPIAVVLTLFGVLLFFILGWFYQSDY